MLPDRAAPSLSAGDLEILQELMNIAFGKASADLAAAHGRPVDLTTPEVQVMPAVLLRYYIGAELKDQAQVGVVAQSFEGDLRGNALLLVPAAMAAERLDETGRILLGGCLGKLAGVLGGRVAPGPAAAAIEDRRAAAARSDGVATGQATVLRALFRVEGAAGYLFLAIGADAVPWLQGALERFMAQYR